MAKVRRTPSSLLNCPDFSTSGMPSRRISSRTKSPATAVILDLLMPRVSGFEVIPKLRTNHPKIGIVAYTAVAGDFVRDEMRRMGIPLVLKSGQFGKLDSILRTFAADES